MGEPLEKVVRGQGLVGRDGVSSSLNSGVGKLVEVLNVASGGTVDIPRGPGASVNGGSVQLSQAKLGLGSGDSGDIDITRVHKNGDIGPFADESLVEGNHALARDVVREGGPRGTDLPDTSRRRLRVDGGLDISTVQVVDSQLIKIGAVGLKSEGPFEGSISEG